MPRKPKVEVSEAINAISLFGNCLKDGDLPAYTDDFSAKVAKALNGKWKAHDVYINLREDRRKLRRQVFQELGIQLNCKEKDSDKCEISKTSNNKSFNGDGDTELENSDANYSVFSTPLSDKEEIFDLIVRHELWEKMKPISKTFSNGRKCFLLPPGVWTHIVADEFWKQYRMPCALSFKTHVVSLDSKVAFLKIIAKCTSKRCNNAFLAIAKEAPLAGGDLWLQVRCKEDTRLDDHEHVIRDLHIGHISADKFQLQYLLPEQKFVFKEYCRLFKFEITVCIDSTASLCQPVQITDDIKSPTIFLYEIVINFCGITLSVGQMLSAAQDTNSNLFFLNNWLISVGITPREAVSDYSRALLGAMSLCFNVLTLKEYIRVCFAALQNPQIQDRPAISYIRIDVAHLIAIFCRLKCFSLSNKAVKDFLIRCIALMVSCEQFERFQEILLLTLTISIQEYDGHMHNSTLPSPAETARSKLLEYISKEEHRAMALIPDEDSEEFKRTIKKLSVSGLDPNEPECFVNHEPDTDKSVIQWIQKLKLQAEAGKDIKHE